jgi:hypothetical protein
MADVTRQAKLLPKVPKELYPVQIKITIYRQSNHATDIGNYSVIEKYTTDALVQSGVLAEDNWQYISSVTLVDGGKDPQNPRATYEILKDNKSIDLESLITTATIDTEDQDLSTINPEPHEPHETPEPD